MNRTLEALEFPRLINTLLLMTESESARLIISGLLPSRDVQWVTEELNRVEEARGFIIRGGSLGTGGLVDIRPFLAYAAVDGSALEGESLLHILHHLHTHDRVSRILEREHTKMPLVLHLAHPLQPLPELAAKIEQCINPEGGVRDRASPELARLRKEIGVQTERIRAKVGAMLPKLIKAGAVRDESYTIRDGRYVLPIRSDSFGAVRGIVHDRSSTGGTLFVEPEAVIDLGNELRKLELAERDEVRRILRELTSVVRQEVGQIKLNAQVITDLDVLWAKATLANKLDSIAPRVIPDGKIHIVHGRHPLLALDPDREVVPLNLELGGEVTTIVISGPNAGGKTVALKTVGLLCVMTACGIPIPAAAGTEIPLFTDFMADIGDQQSLSDDLSTFSAHAAFLKDVLHEAKPGSLVLIDEIGSGTDPQEGSSLSIAVLERMTARKVPTIVTTHHGVLKAFAHSTPGCANGSMEFDRKTLAPTYRFHYNIPGSSYALEIAERVGLPLPIIERARELLGRDRTRLEDLIIALTEKVRIYDGMMADNKERAEEYAAFLAEHDRKMARLKERETEIKKKGAEEVAKVVKEARRTVEAVVREIREQQANREAIVAGKRRLEQLTAEMEAAAVDESNKTDDANGANEPNGTDGEEREKLTGVSAETGDIRKPKPTPPVAKPAVKPAATPFVADKPLETGDSVRVDNSSIVGEVTEISGERVCVAVGSVQLWIKKNRVTLVRKPEESSASSPVRFFTKAPDVPLELHIRGMTAEEATKAVDDYLTNGYASGRSQLTIVHGKGNGVLRNVVRGILRKHQWVKGYRDGEYGEGDYGVTIVDLKNS